MGNASGSELIVPDNLSKSINEAEKKLADLKKTSQETTDAITKGGKDASNNGIGSLKGAIEQLIAAFGNLTKAANTAAEATGKIGTGGGTGVGKVGQDAVASTASITQLTSAVDALRKSMDVMNAARSFINSDELKKAQANIADLQRQIAELKEQYTSLQTTSKGKSTKVVSVDEAQKLADEAKTLGEMQQAIKALQSAQRSLNLTEEDGRQKSQQLANEMARLKEACKQAMMSELQLASAQEKEAAAAEKASVKNADFDTAMAKASGAVTYEERTAAIKACQSALQSLGAAETDSNGKRLVLLATIEKLTESNKQWMVSASQAAEADAKAAEKEAADAEKVYKAKAKAYQEQNYAKNTTYEGAMSFADSANTINRRTQAIKYLEEAQKSLNISDEDGRQKSQQMAEVIARLKKECEQATMSQQQLAAAQEKEAAAAEKAAIKNATYESSMLKANSATTINERTQAIKYLTEARKNLSTTDSQYAQELSALNAKIKELNAANSAAVSGSKQLAASHSHLLNISGQLARSFALLFSVSQVRGYIAEIAKVRGEFEMAQRSLQAIIASKAQADQIYAKTLALAVQSPYRIKDLVKFTRQLAAYRIESDKLFDTTKRLADVAAGLGVDMQRIILAYGQIKAANFLKGTEVRQLTEAGVNIYSELQSYFAEVKGLEYTTADIVSMISKKKVTFEDVEAVFQRMTDKGGMFYNMQLIQSETLQGKIVKFRDSVDIMLNDIGKSTERLFKGTLDSMTALMKNWEALRDVALSAAGLLAAAFAAHKFMAIQLTAEQLASIATISNRTTQVVKANVFRMKNAFRSLWMTIKSVGTAIKTLAPMLLPLLAIEGLVAVLMKWKTANDEYNTSLRETADKYNDEIYSLGVLTKRYEALKKAKEEAAKAGTEGEEGTPDNTEYVSGMRKLLSDLVSSAKSEGYDLGIAPGAVPEKDLDAAYKDAEARYKAFLLQLRDIRQDFAKDEKNNWLFTDSAVDDVKEYSKSLAELSSHSRDMEHILGAFRGDAVWPYLFKNQQQMWEKASEYFDKGAEDAQNYITAMEYISRLSDSVRESLGINVLITEGGYVHMYTDLMTRWRDATRDQEEAYKEISDVLSKNKEKLLAIKDIADRTSRAKALIDAVISDRGMEEARSFIESIAEKEWQVKFTADEDSVEKTVDWVTNYVNNFLESHDFTIRFKGGKGPTNPFEEIYESAKEARKEAKEWQTIFQGIQGGGLKVITLQDLINARTRGASIIDRPGLIEGAKTDWKIAINSLINSGYDIAEDAIEVDMERLSKTMGDAEESYAKYVMGPEAKKANKEAKTASQLLKERISLLKEMEKRYEELRQVYSDAEAAQMTLAQYSDSIATSGLAQFLPAGYAPTKQGTADALRNLTGTAASQKDLTELLKDVAEYELKIRVDVEEESLKEAKDVVETAFSGYELFKDLQDTGLSEAAIKRMFPESGISTSLNDVADIIEYQMGGKEGTKWGDAYNEALQKLADEREKQAMQDMRDLINNYKEHLSDQLQLDIWYQQQRRKIENADFGEGNENIKERIRTNLDKEYQEKTNENTWNDFKSSDLYVSVFDNLEGQSTKMLKYMLAQVQALKGSLQDLTPAQMRSILETEEQLNAEIAGRNPFAAIADGMRKIASLGMTRNEIEKKYVDLLNQQKAAMARVEEQSKKVEELQSAYDKVTTDTSQDPRAVHAQKKELDTEKETLTAYKEEAKEIGEQVGAITNLRNTSDEANEEISSGVDDICEKMEQLATLLDTLADNWANIFGSSLSDSAADTTSALSGALSGAASAVTSYMSGDYLGAAIGAISAIGSLFSTHDAALARKIEALQDEVDDLTRAYEKIEEALTLSITTSDISSNYLSGINNLKQQIADYEEMIELERAKKDTDEDAIKEYQEAIEDLQDQLEDYYNSYIEMLGGVSSDDFRSAAESFAEAWLDAFNEVEDTYDALIDNLQDYLNDMLVAQITNAASEQFIQPIIDSLNEMVEASGDITQLSKEDLDEWWSDSEDLLEQYNDFLEYYFNKLGISPSGSSDSSLSALQQGIQSITEETGAALESLLNSMRFYVATEQADVAIIKTTLLSMASSSTTTSASDPMLVELKAQTALLSSIDMRLSAVTKAGHPEGGRGLKVFLN